MFAEVLVLYQAPLPLSGRCQPYEVQRKMRVFNFFKPIHRNDKTTLIVSIQPDRRNRYIPVIYGQNVFSCKYHSLDQFNESFLVISGTDK